MEGARVKRIHRDTSLFDRACHRPCLTYLGAARLLPAATEQAPAELAKAAEAAAAEVKPPSKLGSLFQRLKSKKVRGLCRGA